MAVRRFPQSRLNELLEAIDRERGCTCDPDFEFSQIRYHSQEELCPSKDHVMLNISMIHTTDCEAVKGFMMIINGGNGLN